MTVKASGYIPEGGVWTAEDSRRVTADGLTEQEALDAFLSLERTVAALVAALEDSHGPIRDSGGCVRAVVGQEPCAVCALLEALK